jgi:hypothetical protein
VDPMTIVATTLYVSLGAQPGPRTGVTKSGIAYDVQGQGPVVVLLTGANLDLRMWAREAAPSAAYPNQCMNPIRAHTNTVKIPSVSRI